MRRSKRMIWVVLAAVLAGCGGDDPQGAGMTGLEGGAPTLAPRPALDGTGWLGAPQGDPREPSDAVRVLAWVRPDTTTSRTFARRLARAMEGVDAVVVWITASQDEQAARRFLGDAASDAPVLLGATEATQRRFRLAGGEALRAYNRDGRLIARDLIGLRAHALDGGRP